MCFSGCLPSGGQHFHVIIFPGIIIHLFVCNLLQQPREINYQFFSWQSALVNPKHLCPYNLTYPQNSNSLTIFCTDSKQLLSILYGKEYPCNYLTITLTRFDWYKWLSKTPGVTWWMSWDFIPQNLTLPPFPLSIRISMRSLYSRPTKIPSVQNFRPQIRD